MSSLLPLPVPDVEVPPLENGDRLSRAEFERRYHAMPDVKKAELIEGVVYMSSPTRFLRHANPHFAVVAWLGAYAAGTPGVLGGDNGTARLDLDNEVQPDALLLIDPARGGQARLSDDDYVEEAPELVAEVAASSASIDLGMKKTAYRRNGVREYVVWRVRNEEIDWFVLREGEYIRLEPDTNGILKSEVFPGLWLDPKALLAGDLGRVQQVVLQGLASPEHAAFASKLNAASPGTSSPSVGS